MTRKCNNNRMNCFNFKNMNFSSPKSMLVPQKQNNENSRFTPVSSRRANKRHIKIADSNVIKIKRTHIPKESTKICVKFLNETCYDRQQMTASENSTAFSPSNVERTTKFVQPKIKRCVETKQQSSILLDSKFCQQVEPPLEIIRRTVSTKRYGQIKSKLKKEENKHDRYVPIILKNPNSLKSTRISRDRTISGSSVNESHNHMETTCNLTRDQNSSKRKRKQVLQPLIQKYDCSNLTIDKEPNAGSASQEKPLSESETSQADDDDSLKTGEQLKVVDSPEETEVEQTILETNVSHSTSTMEPGTAKLELENIQPVEISSTCNYKSIKKIIDEFQVPDYKNYVNFEDFCVDTDDMNKLLLNVDDNEILPIPFYPAHSIAEYDCNDNDIGINLAAIEQNTKLQRSFDFHLSSKSTMDTEKMDFLGFDPDEECPELIDRDMNSSGIVCDWQSSDGSPSPCSISDSDFQNSDSVELFDAAEMTDTSFIKEMIDCSGDLPVVNNDLLENVFDEEMNEQASSELNILQDAEKLLNDKVMDWYFQMDSTDIEHPIIGTEQICYPDSCSNKQVKGNSSREHNAVEAFDNVLNVKGANSDSNNNPITDDNNSGNDDNAILSETRDIESGSETLKLGPKIIADDDPNVSMSELLESKSEMNSTQDETSHDTSTDIESSVNCSLFLGELHELLDNEHCGVKYISDVENENELQVGEVTEATDSENEIHRSEKPDEVSATSGIGVSLKKQANDNYTAQKIETNFDTEICTIEKNPEEEQHPPKLRRSKHIKNEQNAINPRRQQRTADTVINDPSFRCEICDKTYRHKGSLKFHYKKVHIWQNTSRTESDAGKDQKCEMCSKSYALPGALKSHINLHLSFRLTCIACGKHFARTHLLKSHASHCYNIRNLQCIYCGKKFNKEHKLTSHLRVHYDELKSDDVHRKES